MSLSTRTGLLGIYTLCLALGSLSVLRALVERSTSDSSASHLVLIPVVTLWLLYQSRRSTFSSVRFAWRSGPGVILVGLGLLLATRFVQGSVPQDEGLARQVVALVVMWIGGFVLFYGPEAFRSAAFPLLFLAFMIPIPRPLLDGATRVLTVGSAEVLEALLNLTRTPYHREAFVFWLPNLAIEVARECSGIRSTIALFLTSLLAGHMYLRSGWGKALLVAAVFPISILKNGLRIASLSLLSIYVSPSFLTGRLHHEGGVVFFLLALGCLVPVLFVLRRVETIHVVGRRQPAPLV